MPVGKYFSFTYTNMVAMNDRFFPDSEGELKHTHRSPPLEFQVEIRQRTTEQGSPSSIHCETWWKAVAFTGFLSQTGQAAWFR